MGGFRRCMRRSTALNDNSCAKFYKNESLVISSFFVDHLLNLNLTAPALLAIAFNKPGHGSLSTFIVLLEKLILLIIVDLSVTSVRKPMVEGVYLYRSR
jgi:hypothetical protein